MNYNACKQAIIDTVLSGGVPFMRGLHGIGKSEMVEDICNQIEKIKGKEVVLHEIDMSHVKEGELTGMPITKIIKGEDGEEYNINDYTTHNIFFSIINEEAEGFIPVLFLDEINRTDRIVFNEIMPIILARRVQETYLPDSLIIITAGNPENIQELGLSDEYSVLPMDPALKDRFFIFDLESDPNSWITWAMKNDNICSDIIEFISDFPTQLHNLNNGEEIHPTPRAWKKFNDIYINIMKDKNASEEEKEERIINIGKGKIGNFVVLSFLKFMKEKSNPILKAEDFFEVNEEQLKENLSKISTETLTRTHVTMMRIIKYMESDKFISLKKNTHGENEGTSTIFTKILNAVPNDVTMGTVYEITKEHPKLLNRLMKDVDFMKYTLSIKKFLI